MSDEFDAVFEEQAENIRIILGTETQDDPFEKSVSLSYLNGKPIRAIVNDITFAKAQWAMPGITTNCSKEIILKKKYRPLLELSQKIKIQDDDNEYEGWRQNSKMQIRQEGQYLRAYIYIKNV